VPVSSRKKFPGASGQPNPARHKHAQHVSVRKQGDVALDGARPGDHSIRPCADLRRRLSTRAAVAKNQPAGRLLIDLLGGQPLVLAIVPLDQVGVDDGRGPETR
jgi:hypothetical protein